jgi:flagellar biosynthesis protein FlhB
MAEHEEKDKTEQATPRRRQKAREQGQIARSRELVSMAATAGILFVFYMAGTAFMKSITGLTGNLLGLRYGRDPFAVLRTASTETMLLLMPFLLVAVAFAVLSNIMQSGVVFKPLTLELSRLNPLKGLKGLFSVSNLPGVVKNAFKFIVGIILFYIIIKKALLLAPATAAMGLTELQTTAVRLTGKTVAYAFSTFFILALADYGYERWKFERSLKMTKDEIREEYRESEGDPLLKAKIKSLQKETARRRMMEAVPRATVVITNPTHIAVALLYKRSESSAPRVVARGKGFVAQTIRDIARKHGVPLVEDKPLARALYKVKLDAVIPAELYTAVAKILAYIYRLRGVAA